MITINCNEVFLPRILEDIKKSGFIFMDINVPEKDFYEIKDYNRLTRGKVKNVSLILHNSTVGTVEIVITDSDKLSETLKDFLESANLVTFGMSFDLKVMLNYNVKLNIIHDMRCLMQVVYKDKGINNIRTMSLNSILEVVHHDIQLDFNGLDTVGIIEKLYLTHKDFCENKDYENLLKVTKLIAYQSYFGIHTDFDSELALRYTCEVQENMQNICNKAMEKYNVDISNQINVRQYIKNGLGIEERVYLSRKGLMALIRQYPKHIEFFMYLQEYVNNKKYLYYLEKPKKSRINVTDSLELIGNTIGYTDFLPKAYLDVFRTEKKKYYYMAIDCGFILHQKYLEKVCNNTVIPDNIDYHSYTASVLFNKSIDMVTLEERRQAKKYNFYRFLDGVPEKRQYVNDETKSYITDIIEYLPPISKNLLFKGSTLSEYSKLMLSKFANLNDTLENQGNNSIVFSHKEYDCLIFKVSNKINPYRAMKIVSDALDTTEEIGIPLYSIFSVGNSLKEVHDCMTVKQENGVYVPIITYDKMIEQYNKIEQEKLRDVVASVKKDFRSL